MHQQAYDWIARQVGSLRDSPASVLEISSLDINGSIRPLLRGAGHYHGLDLVAGPGVDEVADASQWQPPGTFELVACAEVLEHALRWRAVLATMWAATAPGGTLLMTCATDPRAPHSAVDGHDVRPDEHYANVSLADVRAVVAGWSVVSFSLEWACGRGDLYLRADRAPATADAQASASN